MVAAVLRLWLCRKHGRTLALHVLGLGLLVFWVSIGELEDGEAPLLSPGALGCHVEHLQSRAQFHMDGDFLLLLDIVDAIGERRDDGFVRNLRDLEANAVEALDVLLQGLPWLLLDAPQVTRGRRAVVRALEVGDETLVHISPRGD